MKYYPSTPTNFETRDSYFIITSPQVKEIIFKLFTRYKLFDFITNKLDYANLREVSGH